MSFTEGESQYDAGTIEIRNVNEKWSADNVTWNTQPEIGNVVATVKCSGKENTLHELDITNLFKELIKKIMQIQPYIHIALSYN